MQSMPSLKAACVALYTRLLICPVQDDSKRSLRSGADVPSHAELNRMLARSPDELEVFDHLDATLDWPGQPLSRLHTRNVAHA